MPPITVGVTATTAPLGERLCRRLAAHPGVARVVEVDIDAPDLSGVDVVVHAGAGQDHRRPNGREPGLADLEAVARLLVAADAASPARVILLSSAMVYGAWPNNPVPLTEAAAIRPNADFPLAVNTGELERRASEFRRTHPDTTVVTLRPTTVVDEVDMSWVAEVLRSAISVNAGDRDPPLQFLHLDDLVSAVELAAVGDLEGAYNVAPDGFVDFDTVHGLTGRGPRVRVSERAAKRFARLGWRWGLATPPGLVPYTIHPWVVANDRLRSAGWSPTHTNEQAWVSGDRPRPWAMMNARTRQRLALGASVALAAGGVGLAAWLVARRRARR